MRGVTFEATFALGDDAVLKFGVFGDLLDLLMTFITHLGRVGFQQTGIVGAMGIMTAGTIAFGRFMDKIKLGQLIHGDRVTRGT